MPRSEFAMSYGVSALSFLRNIQIVLQKKLNKSAFPPVEEGCSPSTSMSTQHRARADLSVQRSSSEFRQTWDVQLGYRFSGALSGMLDSPKQPFCVHTGLGHCPGVRVGRRAKYRLGPEAHALLYRTGAW